MMDAEMTKSAVAELVPVFEVIAWGVIIVIVVLLLRKELKAFLCKFTSADELTMSLGSLTVKARAMRELHDSIDINFPEGTVKKGELAGLINAKLRGIQAAIDRELTDSDIRSDPRVVKRERIKIETESGEVFDGETIDISKAGIAFKSKGRLRFQEVVKISPVSTRKKLSDSAIGKLRIVRIEQSEEGYHYGAAIPPRVDTTLEES